MNKALQSKNRTHIQLRKRRKIHETTLDSSIYILNLIAKNYNSNYEFLTVKYF